MTAGYQVMSSHADGSGYGEWAAGCGLNVTEGMASASQGDPSSLPQASSADTTTATLSEASDTVRTLCRAHVTADRTVRLEGEGVVLTLDSGSVRTAVDVVVSRVAPGRTAALPAGLHSVTADAVRLQPKGQRFDRPVTLSLRYKRALLPHGFRPSDIHVYRYDNTLRCWQRLPHDSVDTARGVVTALTDRLGDYIAGVLQEPENDGPAQHTATTLSDLSSPHPLDGITVMAPPEAENSGAATLEYPLALPAGRNGMAPHLSVRYNSGGGNGILGLGWSLPISEISVDTRWGVPRYDAQYETEEYLLDGAPLTTAYTDSLGLMRLSKPVHRRTYAERHGDERFYARVEGSFRRIVRHGGAPDDYWWEVTDKDGTRHIYGENEQARLSDGQHRTARWLLERSEDTYGNTVEYRYHTRASNNGAEEAGRQVVLDEIRYSGNVNTDEQGPYRVKFRYAEKVDAGFSFRHGFQENDGVVLDRVEVHYDNQLIRDYWFGYRRSALGKTLLCCIIEAFDDSARYQRYRVSDIKNVLLETPYNRCGLELKDDLVFPHHIHTFEYYDLAEGSEWFDSPISMSENLPDENIFDALTYILAVNKQIGGNASGGWSVTGGANAGLGYNCFLKNLTIGGRYSYSSDESLGTVTLADLDGDGLPDKLYRTIGGTLKCCRQLAGNNAFDSPVAVNGADAFLRTENSTDSWGAEVNVAGPVGGGAVWNDSRSTTYTYLLDVNGDGLTDIVDDGHVLINRGNLRFDDVTHNDTLHIGGGCADDTLDFRGTVTPQLFADGLYTVDRLVCNNQIQELPVYDTLPSVSGADSVVFRGTELVLVSEDCHTVTDTFRYIFPRRYEPAIDPVRMWVAPYAGTVRVDDTARLSDSLADLRAATGLTDGVWLSVQRAGDTVPVASGIAWPDSAALLSGQTTVAAGDTLFFRIHALGQRQLCEVEWNPHIRYMRAVLRDGTVINDPSLLYSTDANGDRIYRFNYSDDYLLSGVQGVSVADTTPSTVLNSYIVRRTVHVTDTLSLPLVSSIVLCDTNGTEQLLRSDTLYFSTPNDIALLHFLDNVNGSHLLRVRLSAACEGQVRWSAVEAGAEVTLTGSSSAMLSVLLQDTMSRKTFVYHPSVEIVRHDYLSLPGEPVSITTLDPTTFAVTVTTGDGVPYTGTLPLTVTNGKRRVIYICDVSFTNGSGSVTIPPVQLHESPYHFDFHTADTAVARRITCIRVGSQRAGLYVRRAGGDNERHHGTLYRGWGQFGYKGDSTSLYIRRELMRPDSIYEGHSPVVNGSLVNSIESAAAAAASPEELSSAYGNPLAGTFFEMRADGAHRRWTCYGDAATITRWRCSLDGRDAGAAQGGGRTVVHAASPMPVVTPGTPVKAVNRQTADKSKGFTVLMTTGGSGTVRMLGDCRDLNGDGYPDNLSEARVQYSKAQGGLEPSSRGYCNGSGLHRSTHVSVGVSCNGTFPGAGYDHDGDASQSRVEATEGSGGNFGGNIDHSESIDQTTNTLMDVNGDGLPDIVYGDGTVCYNRGYGFTAPRLAAFASLHSSSSSATHVGASFNIGNSSISGGLGGSRSTNSSVCTAVDLDGDGRPDQVGEDDIYILTNGHVSHFESAGTDGSTTTSLGVHGAITADVPVPLISVKAGVSLGGGLTAAFTASNGEFVDIDGDGLPDYVYHDADGIKYRRCQAGRSGLLRSVTTPSQARYLIDYSLSAPSVASPGRRWEMTGVKICSGFPQGGSGDTLYRRHSYSGRRYDRAEREDCGVAEAVTLEYTSRLDWVNRNATRCTLRRWHNGRWQLRGLPVEETVEDIPNGTRQSTFYTWREADLRDGHWHSDSTAAWCRGDAWPALASVQTVTHETSGNDIATRHEYSYGPYGNVVRDRDRGNVDDLFDDCDASLRYDTRDTASYIVANVVEQTVTDSHGDTLRHRTASYNHSGTMDTLRIQLDSATVALWRFVYDPYGNIDKLFTPQTDTLGHPYWIQYRYDNIIHTLPEQTEDVQGYTSYADYDLRWQKPLVITDIGGDNILCSYDSHGNIDSVVAPRENNIGYTLRCDYWYNHRQSWQLQMHPENTGPAVDGGLPRLLWTRSLRRDERHPGDTIESSELCDGLGRVILRKREASVNGHLRHVVEGAVIFDAMGRAVKQVLPVDEDSTSEMVHYSPRALSMPFEAMTYDGFDRVRRIDHADGTVERFDYDAARDNAGTWRQRIIATDRDGRVTQQLADHRGDARLLIDAYGGETQLFRDALGRVTAATDAEHHTATYRYDRGGRRIERTHPSTGVTRWRYDAAGNVTREKRNSGDSTDYVYNNGRLQRVLHSRSPWNDVRYEYGAPNRGGASGRVVMRQDAAGVTRYGYDYLGNVTMERRTCVVPGDGHTLAFVTHWDYDSWGRLLRIDYPDGETVTYSYDLGGSLRGVRGDRQGLAGVPYVRDIRYNRHGQRVLELDGDSVESHWVYDTLNQRLVRMRALSLRESSQLLDVNYSYSPQGDILSVDDHYGTGRYQSFVYDHRHRLTYSEGDWNGIVAYTAGYEYSPSGRLTRKNVRSGRMDWTHGQYTLDYDNRYLYPTVAGTNVFAADIVYDALRQSGRRLWWDADGNLSREYYRYKPSLGEEERMERRLCHTEEGMMQGYWQESGDRHRSETVAAWYAYDAEGRRALKYASERAAGSGQSSVELCDPVYYVSPLVTLTRTGYSKHYFEGGRRICTVIGGGFGMVPWDSVTHDLMPVVGPHDDELAKVLQMGAESTFGNCIGVQAELSNTLALYKMMQNESERYETHEPAFYYHTDHLGSTSRFTDDSGKVVQTLAYMPYGEDWVDDSKFTYTDTNHIGIYQFNGKERDFESGFYYYGARYHWPELWTGWTTPDPLMDKYPGISPYNYCNWNPVIFMDPDGNFPIKTHKEIVTIAFSGTSIGKVAMQKVLYGSGVHSDIWNMFNAKIHFDNINNSESIKDRFRTAYKNFTDNMENENYIAAGEDLHTIADFYSHSNYIDLYSQYAAENGLSMSVEDIPIFSELMDDDCFMEYANNHGGLRTGTYSISSWISEKLFHKKPQEGSHTMMNLDSNNSINGSLPYNSSQPNSPSRHEAAKATAQKETNKLVKSVR